MRRVSFLNVISIDFKIIQCTKKYFKEKDCKSSIMQIMEDDVIFLETSWELFFTKDQNGIENEKEINLFAKHIGKIMRIFLTLDNKLNIKGEIKEKNDIGYTTIGYLTSKYVVMRKFIQKDFKEYNALIKKNISSTKLKKYQSLREIFKKIGIDEKYVKVFIKHKIDPEDIEYLNEEDLRELFKEIGYRAKLMKYIHNM